MSAGLVIKIGADVQGAIRGISKVNRAIGDEMTGFEKFKHGVDRAFVPAIATLGAMGTAALLAAKKASDLAETQSKVGQIFGESAKELDKWALEAPNALGQTQAAALDAASTMATFGKAAGLTGTELVNFSKETVNLSSDLASFYNADPSEVVTALGAALRGESEPMRKFGVLLNDQTLKAEALALGIYDGTGALTAQQKVLAAQAAIMKQTTDAQGDFARTSDGAANQQRILAANMQQFQTELGSVFLPVLEKVTTLLSSMAGWMRENQTLALILAGAVAGLAAAVVAIKVAMTVAAAATWLFNSALLANPITWIVVAIAALIAAVILMYNKFDWFKNFIDGAWKVIKAAADVFVKWFKNTAWPIIKRIIDFIVGYYKFLWSIVKWVWNLVYGIVETFVVFWRDKAWPIIKKVIDFIVGYYEFLWNSIKAVWDFIYGVVETFVIFFRDKVKPIIDRVVTAIIGFFTGLRDKVKSIWEAIKRFILGPVNYFNDTIKPKIESFVNGIKRIFEGLRDAIYAIFERIKQIVTGAWNVVMDKINSIRNGLSSIPIVGGIVGRSAPGAQVIPFGTRSASVLSSPRSVTGAGLISSPTVIVNGALDPVAVAKQIRRILRDENSRMGSVA